MKIKELIKDFVKNLKEYVSYLMKVNYKELFVNTVILFCILILASFVYLPVSLIDDLIYSFITMFVSLPVIAGSIYHWIFQLISFILAVLAFMYLFNMRFKDIKEKGINNQPIVVKDKEKKTVTLDLPKTKDSK